MKPIHKAFNQETRKYEVVDIELDEFAIGATVLEFVYSGQLEKYVTIPGASIMQLTNNGWQYAE